MREEEHALRNKLWSLRLRGDLASEDAVRLREELEAKLADAQRTLAELARCPKRTP